MIASSLISFKANLAMFDWLLAEARHRQMAMAGFVGSQYSFCGLAT
jgi:hypothetical protein